MESVAADVCRRFVMRRPAGWHWTQVPHRAEAYFLQEVGAVVDRGREGGVVDEGRGLMCAAQYVRAKLGGGNCSVWRPNELLLRAECTCCANVAGGVLLLLSSSWLVLQAVRRDLRPPPSRLTPRSLQLTRSLTDRR